MRRGIWNVDGATYYDLCEAKAASVSTAMNQHGVSFPAVEPEYLARNASALRRAALKADQSVASQYRTAKVDHHPEGFKKQCNAALRVVKLMYPNKAGLPSSLKDLASKVLRPHALALSLAASRSLEDLMAFTYFQNLVYGFSRAMARAPKKDIHKQVEGMAQRVQVRGDALRKSPTSVLTSVAGVSDVSFMLHATFESCIAVVDPRKRLLAMDCSVHFMIEDTLARQEAGGYFINQPTPPTQTTNRGTGESGKRHVKGKQQRRGGVGLLPKKNMTGVAIDLCCANCGGGTKLFVCSRCKRTHYCSRACQSAHWKAKGGHKADCSTVLTLSEMRAHVRRCQDGENFDSFTTKLSNVEL
uniref:MYND-type domain-containing protein n=2 Tax=Octactis speculum TaxID=3111310 RepID=A0A7S2CSQ1_9STRA|mmetsp:Transcript_39439/g.53556  ORF Transcript_39439/g.53556 Transcript_39439/m.53556 type:complete len:358 (+) Transcript_39439:27-1100(+)